MVNFQYKNRLSKLQELLKEESMVYFISCPANISYLTGVTQLGHQERDAFMIITPDRSIIFSSPLKLDQFKSQEIPAVALNKKNSISDSLNSLDISTILYDSSDLHVDEFEQLNLKTKIKWIPGKHYLDKMREVKDEEEIHFIKQACKIAAKTAQEVKAVFKVGISEIETAEKIRTIMFRMGADGIPQNFDPIVAFGENSAVPHHTTSSRRLKKNEVILMDFGCTISGYTSDISRTFFFGTTSDQFKKVEHAVNKAVAKALEMVEKKSSPDLIDQKVRDFFKNQGFEQQVLHSVGHGVGLQIHEKPHLSFNYPHQTLESGMTITIEPGLYFSSQFGYRHEETILVTDTGYEILTKISEQE